MDIDIETIKKNNRFYEYRGRIKMICIRYNKDIYTASNILASEMLWFDCEQEMKDWMDLCKYYQEDDKLSLEDLLNE